MYEMVMVQRRFRMMKSDIGHQTQSSHGNKSEQHTLTHVCIYRSIVRALHHPQEGSYFTKPKYNYTIHGEYTKINLLISLYTHEPASYVK